MIILHVCEPVQSCEFEYDYRVFRCAHWLVVQLRVAKTHNTTSRIALLLSRALARQISIIDYNYKPSPTLKENERQCKNRI